MKGVRFYLEYPNSKEKRKGTRKELGNHSGQVIALFHENIVWARKSTGEDTFASTGCDALAGIYDKPNSPVASTIVSYEFLRERCKRISEELAREIHPELFIILDEGH